MDRKVEVDQALPVVVDMVDQAKVHLVLEDMAVDRVKVPVVVLVDMVVHRKAPPE